MTAVIRQLHDLSEQQQIDHARVNGGYNAFPPNWREISEGEFAQSRHFLLYPELWEFRQMLKRDARGSIVAPAVAAHLQWQRNGIGFAVVNDFWEKRVRFFTFGQIPEGYAENFDSSD